MHDSNNETFACYHSETDSVSDTCGGDRCRSADDCDRGQQCLDISMWWEGIGKPGVSCDYDATRCVTSAMAEAVLGVPSSALFPLCRDVSNFPGTCEQGWTPGGSYLAERVYGTGDSCPNGICDDGEYPNICAADCNCGDGECAPAEIGECIADCGECGDGNPDPWETPKTCPEDAVVEHGDGSCDPSEVITFPEDCGCGEASVAFRDFAAVCGDGLCQPGGPPSRDVRHLSARLRPGYAF